MSLVNDVLRDLDSRKRHSAAQQQRVAGVLGVPAERRRPTRVLVAGIAVAGVIVGLGAGFLYFRPGEEFMPAPQPPAAQPPLVIPDESRMAATPEPAATPAPAPALASPEPAPVELAELVYLPTATGFRLSLPASARPDYEVTSRSSYGINVLVRDTVFASSFPSEVLGEVEGLSVYPVRDGLNLNLELAGDAEFEVYDRNMNGRSELVIEVAQWRAPVTPPPVPLAVAPEQQQLQGSMALPAPVPAATPARATASGDAAADADAGSGREVRTTREPTFVERDRDTSQSAVRLAQRGRLLEAYDMLLAFIGANAEAHISRETLATILFAQQDFTQAATLVRDGLALAPNYAPYKKLQARLLIRDNRAAEALTLLRQVPPAIEQDSEYHDLMASLQQQSGDHAGAVASYQQLLARDPAQSRWWAAMAISLEALDRPRDAIASFQKALQGSDLDAGIRRYSQARVNSLKLQP